METKKVIEQERLNSLKITSDIEGDIWIRQDDETVFVEKLNRTTAAKAICPKYQETEDENKILKEQIESIFKNANDKVSLLEQRYAKVLEALKMHVDSLDLSNMEFYEKYGFNVADVFPRTRQLIQQSETK